jgi:formylmethanofuran dehydrogenase subunit A
MLIRLHGGAIYDPAHGLDGKVGEIWIRDDQIVDRPESPQRCDYHFDLTDCFVMAGAIDLHTHIGGGKTNIARMLLPDFAGTRPSGGGSKDLGQTDPPPANLRDPLLRGDANAFLPAAPMVGRRYLEMGYTACFEPAMIPCNARGTHAELADTPAIDTGCYVILGNEDHLLRMIRDSQPQEVINQYVAAAVWATQAIGVKVVNPGGINAFKFNVRKLDVDSPHPVYGVTPAAIIRTLAKAVDQIGLPQPLHVHASNLGVAGNIESTLKTIRAADGHRIHLTHVQFHSYGAEGPQGFSSAAEQIVKAIERYPNLTVDVGQVMFGQTVTISADTMHQFASRSRAKPRKSVIVDVECQAGCGVVPFRYRNRRYVNALQWAIGLELFLMVDDPSRIFLTTDHPNGGPFTSYPHLIRLLMDRSFRETALAEVHDDARAASQLGGMDRQYSLADIAVMTRSAPARFLGLENMGTLTPGAVADVVVYRRQPDWERTFARPSHVFRRGRLVVRDGQMIDSVDKVTHAFRPATEGTGNLPSGFTPIGADEMETLLGVRPQYHPPRSHAHS